MASEGSVNQSEEVIKEKFEKYEDLEVVKVLQSSLTQGSIAIEGRLKNKDGRVALMLEKLPFDKEKATEIFAGIQLKETLFNNDIYYNQVVTIPQDFNELKASVVFPAEDKHIKKFERDEVSFVLETPELYEKITKNYIETSSYSKQWIYNILEHKQEAERIICEDLDPEVGFILVPDMHWTGLQLENLYAQAIVMRRDIPSMRDLNASHIPLLENVYEKCTKAIFEKYGVSAHKLRVYLHYQPSFYHLHVHIASVLYESGGTWVGKAHHLSEVVSNLKGDADHYKKAVLPFTIKDNHPLREKFREHGYFGDETPEKKST